MSLRRASVNAFMMRRRANAGDEYRRFLTSSFATCLRRGHSRDDIASMSTASDDDYASHFRRFTCRPPGDGLLAMAAAFSFTTLMRRYFISGDIYCAFDDFIAVVAAVAPQHKSRLQVEFRWARRAAISMLEVTAAISLKHAADVRFRRRCRPYMILLLA